MLSAPLEDNDRHHAGHPERVSLPIVRRNLSDFDYLVIQVFRDKVVDCRDIASDGLVETLTCLLFRCAAYGATWERRTLCCITACIIANYSNAQLHLFSSKLAPDNIDIRHCSSGGLLSPFAAFFGRPSVLTYGWLANWPDVALADALTQDTAYFSGPRPRALRIRTPKLASRAIIGPIVWISQSLLCHSALNSGRQRPPGSL